MRLRLSGVTTHSIVGVASAASIVIIEHSLLTTGITWPAVGIGVMMLLSAFVAVVTFSITVEPWLRENIDKMTGHLQTVSDTVASKFQTTTDSVAENLQTMSDTIAGRLQMVSDTVADNLQKVTSHLEKMSLGPQDNLVFTDEGDYILD